MSRLGGPLLLALGSASLWFALAGDYALLMNPAFRWVTLAGAGLVILMGAALAGRPARVSASAVAIFALFFVLVAVAQPQAGGVAPRFGPPEGAPAVDRDGYPPLPLQRLFQTLDQEAATVPEGQAAVQGVVKRLPALDAEQTFILLDPMMACCLADAVAFGVRVRVGDGALPEDGSWVHAFGDLAELPAPVRTPPFRLGAILFAPVSRIHELRAHEVVSYRTLLEDLFDKTPDDFAATFRRLALETGVADTLRAEGPFTVFALHEAAFQSMPGPERDALLADSGRLRALLEGLIVRGRHDKEALYDVTSLTTLAGTTLPVREENGRLRIGGARVLLGPLEARNGVLYVVHPLPRRER